MKFGLIGAGRWAEIHKAALESLDHQVSSVLVVREASATHIAKTWGCHTTTHPNTFFAQDIEAVIVVSPNYLHAQHTLAALKAGKHVLCEKPMATRSADAQEMFKVATEQQKVLAIGLEMRVFSLFAQVKQLINQGAIGQPCHLKLDLWRRPYRTGASGWKADPAKMGSSTLEEPVHYLDLARWYLHDTCGEVNCVQAWATSRKGRDLYNENLDVRLTFASGAQALVTRSIAAYEHSVFLQLVGEEGSLRAQWRGAMDLDRAPRVSLELHNSGDRDALAERLEVVQHTGHAFDVPRQTEAFIQAITSKTPPAATAEDGLMSVLLCELVDTSLAQGSTPQPFSL